MNMGDRADFLRSLVRGFAEGAGKRLGLPLATLQKAIREAVLQASSVSDRQITEGAHAGFVRARGERGVSRRPCLDRSHLRRRRGRPAQRGAGRRSLRATRRQGSAFRVEPEGMAGRARARDLVGCHRGLDRPRLAGHRFSVASCNPSFDAIAGRDGAEVRVDLRSVPAVRAARRRSCRSCSTCWIWRASAWSMAHCACRSSCPLLA